MTIEVTLKLPNGLVEEAQRLGHATSKDAATVLTEALEQLWPTLENFSEEAFFPTISGLADDQVLQLATGKMQEAQNARLGELQATGKVDGLSEPERYELLALLQIYQLGQLRKSEALAEAVKRGLLEPVAQ
ncbi:hypothetical protein XM38_040580 [Halomicronema hongdechloris C2206]|uniref:Uncharacterized protein n=1 Tax=Halomicronema hongdechloris C2206 TaxID=1641165 RepID=A0A1Z3HS49_9CYAN|nr:hypothetical protein [Halomicronema hongdechloris]ASC73096.1 hypothetical protein XM38_040580 [Halomicronema hongdechloris C2206]